MSQVFRSILSNRIPGQVVVQITDRCNARCPQCGMRVTESFARSTLQTDTIKRMIDAGMPGGKFFFGTLVMPYGIPEENIKTMLSSAYEFGSYANR